MYLNQELKVSLLQQLYSFVTVAKVKAVPADTPKVVKVVVNRGTRANPPEATTATIANTAPITIVTVMRISFQCSLHHSQALSTFSSSQFFQYPVLSIHTYRKNHSYFD